MKTKYYKFIGKRSSGDRELLYRVNSKYLEFTFLTKDVLMWRRSQRNIKSLETDFDEISEEDAFLLLI